MGEMPKIGDRAPEFELTDSTGGKRSLTEFLNAGNVVLVFFRGLW